MIIKKTSVINIDSRSFSLVPPLAHFTIRFLGFDLISKKKIAKDENRTRDRWKTVW